MRIRNTTVVLLVPAFLSAECLAVAGGAGKHQSFRVPEHHEQHLPEGVLEEPLLDLSTPSATGTNSAGVLVSWPAGAVISWPTFPHNDREPAVLVAAVVTSGRDIADAGQPAGMFPNLSRARGRPIQQKHPTRTGCRPAGLKRFLFHRPRQRRPALV